MPPPKQELVLSLPVSNFRFARQELPGWSRAAILLSMGCVLLPRGVDLQLGTIMISPSRLVLTVFGIMAANQLISGAIKIRTTPADWLMLTHVGIIALSAVYHSGFGEGLENAIATVTDMGLAYFVARMAVRNRACYRYFVRIVLVIAAISAVFALVEMLTGYSVIRNAYHILFPKVDHLHLYEQRLSLYRSLATFGHWILLGLYCVLAFALAVHAKPYHLRMGKVFYIGCLVLCVAGVFASLSSGPWTAFCLCIFCLVYGRFMRNVQGRWKLLLVSAGIGFLFLSIVSNRGPLKMIASFALSPATAYGRIYMWEMVLALMPDNWLLGWGWGDDWPRPEWFIWVSIDSYYAVWLVRSGVFSVLSIVAFLGYSWYRISKVIGRKYFFESEARGWVLATVALFIMGVSVHIFGNLIFAVYFLFGAGQILFDTCESTPHLEEFFRKSPTRTSKPNKSFNTRNMPVVGGSRNML